jgi:hypothetical protein
VPLGPFLGKSFATLDLRLGHAVRRLRGRPGRPARVRSRSRWTT